MFNNDDKEYLYHPVPGETTRQTVERNYYKYVEPKLQMDYTELAQFIENTQNNKNLIPPHTTEYSIQDDKNYAWEAPRQNYMGLEQQSKHSIWDGVPTALATGSLGGVVVGVERGLNNLTDGAYGNLIDNLTSNSYTNRQNMLQNQANQAGVGYANRIANSAIDISTIALRDLLGIKYGGKIAKKVLK